MNRKQIDGALDAYAHFLAAEFENYGNTRYFQESLFDVIFFGGGTPTVFSAAQLELILSTIQKNVHLSPNYEFTFESTLHNLTEDKLATLMQYGVNRFSIGIQTFSDAGRQFYNRTYDKETTIKKLKKLQEKFPGEVCVDIIYNFPNETLEEIRDDVRILKDLGISSVSFYSLMVHEGSQLSQDIRNEKVQWNPDLTQDRDYELYRTFVTELLADERYYVLELTKIARKGGDHYRYIEVRNHGGDTFPIGSGAGGSVGNIGIYRMNQQMSFFTRYHEDQRRFSKLSGLMQFPKIIKKDVRSLLPEMEYALFLEKMRDYETMDLLRESVDDFILTTDGIFWGNNLSADTITDILERTFKK
jgi:oxygen-independent coproporphyrinogen-3 oxidase